jgi:hypothetical protein
MSIQEAVGQAAAWEGIDPSYLDDDPAPGEELNERFLEIVRYMEKNGPASVRRTFGVSPCEDEDCGGVILKLEAKVPGAVRFDGCCATCGKYEFHRAGWTSAEVRDSYRAATGSVEVG